MLYIKRETHVSGPWFVFSSAKGFLHKVPCDKAEKSERKFHWLREKLPPSLSVAAFSGQMGRMKLFLLFHPPSDGEEGDLPHISLIHSWKRAGGSSRSLVSPPGHYYPHCPPLCPLSLYLGKQAWWWLQPQVTQQLFGWSLLDHVSASTIIHSRYL